MTWIFNGSTVLSPVVPLLLGAPKYLAGEIGLGELMQIATAFAQVQLALNWLADNAIRLAEWLASAQRVVELSDVLDDLDATIGRYGSSSTVVLGDSPDDSLCICDLSLTQQNGKLMIEDADVVIAPGEKVLVKGESGTGKSTLIRAMAGLWPWGSGQILRPKGATFAFMPQRPYLPLGTLRHALLYPAEDEGQPDEALAEALRRCGLAHLVPRLHEEDQWESILSGGEKQRLAFARLLVSPPDIIIMDESTAALDEESQARMLDFLRTDLAAGDGALRRPPAGPRGIFRPRAQARAAGGGGPGKGAAPAAAALPQPPEAVARQCPGERRGPGAGGRVRAGARAGRDERGRRGRQAAGARRRLRLSAGLRPSRAEASAERDRGDLAALLALDRLDDHPLAFLKVGQAGAHQRRAVDEHVLAAVLDGDEAEALGGIVPFDGAGLLLGGRAAEARTAAAPGPDRGRGRRSRRCGADADRRSRRPPPPNPPPPPKRGRAGSAVEASTSRISVTCGPFWPCAVRMTSLVPGCISVCPAVSTTRTCRKASPEPSAISTKPKPFSGLNHLTVASCGGPEAIGARGAIGGASPQPGCG